MDPYELLHTIDRYGIASAETELRQLWKVARARNIKPAILPLLIDPTVPDPVRERAAAQVVGVLVRPPTEPTLAATA